MPCETAQLTTKTLSIFMSILNKNTPKKKIVIRGNHKLHLNKELRKAIMLRSRLKKKPTKLKVLLTSQPIRSSGIFKPRRLYLTGGHLFEVRWNDHLMNYFSLMHHCGINTNFLPFTFSRALF